MIKILVLWSHPSGYISSCLNQLSHFAHVTAIFFHPSGDAPFDLSIFNGARFQYLLIQPPLDDHAERERVAKLFDQDFDLCLVSGWNHSFYLNLCASCLAQSCFKVICFDWQWTPSLRNHLKALYGRFLKTSFFHGAFVPGERQFQYAIRAGFSLNHVYQGLYTSGLALPSPCLWRERFDRIVFVGRLVESKGCRDLIKAWSSLQSDNALPKHWELHVAGIGPFLGEFEKLEKCITHGFMQPDKIAYLLSSSKILSAPSLEEPWGVQIHEATCHGLAVICSTVCGSGVHLVQSDFNGYVVPPSHPSAISRAITRLVAMDQNAPSVLQDFGMRSWLLSQQFSPERWAKTILRMLEDLRTQELS